MVCERLTGFRFNDRTPLRLVWSLGLLFAFSIFLAVPAEASDTSPLGFVPDTRARHLEENNTFHLERSFRYPASDTLVRFLFEELDVNAAMVRGWNLLELHAPRIDTRIYRAQVGDRMEGPAYKLTVRPGRVRYVGQGIYRQDYLPFAIEGSALMDLEWTPIPDTDAVDMTATLRLRPTSQVLHLIGTLFHPVAKSALDDALNRVIDLGRTLARRVRDHPEQTTRHLKTIDEKYAQNWETFRKRHLNPAASDTPTRTE